MERTRPPHTVVVVGGGIAGLRAAERLRERGYVGRIVIVGEESHKPYNRTPLSKQLLAETGRLDDLRLPVFHELDVTWRLGTRAVGVDLPRRRVLLPRGEELEFDGLVIATGVEARALSGAPLSSEFVWTLRDLTDGRGLGRRLADGARHVAVVGTGFIGCEVASSLRQRGMEVSLVGRGRTLMSAALGGRVGSVMTVLHRRRGVHLWLGRQPVAWATADGGGQRGGRHRGRQPGVSIRLDDGSRVDADVAVVAVGSVPAVRWLAGSGLDISDGVLTTPTTHAVTAAGLVPSVVAAGDVARLPNVLFDWTPRRVEHWITASEHGQAAADALLVGPAQARPFTPLPRFWTEQFGARIQSVGRPGLADNCRLVEGSVRDMEFVACYTRAGIMVGAVGCNTGPALIDYADLIGWPIGSQPLPADSLPATQPLTV